MATFKARLAPRRDIVLVFAACVFPVHVWAILNSIWHLPGWILRSDLWDLAGLIAYLQIFALAESVLILLFLVTITTLLPDHLLKDRFVAQGTMFVCVSTLWAVLMHYNEAILTSDSTEALVLSIAGWLISIAVGYVLVNRFSRLECAVRAATDWLLPLSLLYVGLDLIGLVVVTVRNIQGFA